MKKGIFIIITIILTQISWAQKQDSTAYTINFHFNKGLLLSFQDLKNNQALPFCNIITKYDYRKNNFLDLLLQEKKIRFFKNGKKQVLAISDIWGYVD